MFTFEDTKQLIKLIRKEEIKRLEKEAKKCPPGTRIMPEEERKLMLKELQDSKKNIEAELIKFPLTMKTLAIQRKKKDMEEQLEKVDSSIKLFSKDIVYVQI